MEYAAQILILGFLSGAVFASVSFGFSMVFGVLNIVNFAHGLFILLGAFILYSFTEAIGINPFILLPLSAISVGLFGYCLQRFVINRVMEQSIPMVLLLTLGISLSITEAVKMIWGHEEIFVRVIKGGQESFLLGGIYFPWISVYVFFATAIATVFFFLILNKTEMGMAIRACRDNVESAKLVGIDTNRIYNFTTAIAGAWTGVAGAMVVTLEVMPPEGAMSWLLVAFVVTIIGGLGSMAGVLLGGFLIGLVSSLCSGYINPGWINAILYGLLVVMLIIKPTGILGVAEAQKR